MTDDPRKRGADIEIYETVKNPSPITVAKHVRINGTDIGYLDADNPITIERDTDGVTRVTVTMIARSVNIHQETEETDAQRNIRESVKYAKKNYGGTMGPSDGHILINNQNLDVITERLKTMAEFGLFDKS